MSKEHILHKTRTAAGRSAGQVPAPLDPPRIRIPEMDRETRLARFTQALENLGGVVYHASSAGDALRYVTNLLGGRTAVASGAPLLAELGITTLPNVSSGISDEPSLRALCASAGAGITRADYALADTGTLVLFSSPQEARMISLLPPLHLAVIRQDQILTSLDELFSREPLPGDRSSSMVLITGPSRTADIEQILIRGVHGPGEIHVVVV
ncbi:MAG: LutC/YkgG family protein [Bryobacteraceae bacterium]